METVNKFEAELKYMNKHQDNISRLAEALYNKKYVPNKVEKVEIDKTAMNLLKKMIRKNCLSIFSMTRVSSLH